MRFYKLFLKDIYQTDTLIWTRQYTNVEIKFFNSTLMAHDPELSKDNKSLLYEIKMITNRQTTYEIKKNMD
ncbi:hypothetical protein BpHYR1_008556 [Brachionus plicatilis]|uniref:Uncharacterized protein n=1 Tax=Brachionus plicatilis TaxID=10195 RepID=A0A3M7PDC2_BRAPC|nr:hypothetical protein BpHYR1_008556 [Brachionus plicatilis]